MCPVSMVTPVQAAVREVGCRFSPTDGGSCGDPAPSPARAGATPPAETGAADRRKVQSTRWPRGLLPGIRGRRGVGSAPCTQPRRRGRPLARRPLVGPASLGRALPPDGYSRGRGARRRAAQPGALPRR